MHIFQKETKEDTFNRLFLLTNRKDYGIFPPPMNAQVALNELCRFLLGEDWHSANPVSQGQINTEIVYEIERKMNRHKK